MSKAVLMSIQPRFCELIANGKKTIEIRKTKPKLQTPFKVYIYETKWIGNTYWVNRHKGKLGKVIGYFVCDRIDTIGKRGINNNFDYCYLSLNVWGNDDIEIEITDIKKSCISKSTLNEYGANTSCLYAWHISNLVIYDQPKELSEFWLYNEELHKRYESDEDYCAWGNGTTESGCPTNDCEGTDLLQCYQCWEYWSGWCHKLKKAPQSWCYVEELDND